MLSCAGIMSRSTSSKNYRRIGGGGERSRSPVRSQRNSHERTVLRLEEAAMLKVEETNLFELEDLFPEVEVRIRRREISFVGPAYKKKQFMMKIFGELQKSRIESPRYFYLHSTHLSSIAI